MRRHKNGAILHVSLSVSPVYDADDRLIGVSKVSRDITAAKDAEAALDKSESRLKELHAQLLHLSRLSAMGQMATTLAHELNQPLTAISNYMQAARALLERGGDAPLPRIADAMDRAGEQAVRDRSSSGCAGWCRAEAAELAMFDMRQRRVNIRLEDGPADVSILADRIQIQQVLLNLLRNAAEAVADGTIATSLCEPRFGTMPSASA
jgi:two-component system sensor kinase FixL